MQRILLLLAFLFGVPLALSKPEDLGNIRRTTVYAWPLSSSPSKLAEIEYSPIEKSASVISYTPPTSPSGLVLVGLYDSSTKIWLGNTVTSAASFKPEFQGTISLHVSAEGEAWRVAFHSSRKSVPSSQNGGDTRDDQPKVEILRPAPAPQPHLNRPVVLSPDGKLPEKEVEKSFLQKWVISLSTKDAKAGLTATVHVDIGGSF